MALAKNYLHILLFDFQMICFSIIIQQKQDIELAN